MQKHPGPFTSCIFMHKMVQEAEKYEKNMKKFVDSGVLQWYTRCN